MAFAKIARGDSFLDRTVNFEYMFSSVGSGKLLYSKHHGYQANCDKEIRVLDWQKMTYMSGFNKEREQFRMKSTKLLKRREELEKFDGSSSQIALRCHSAPPNMMTSYQGDSRYRQLPVSIVVVEIIKTSNELNSLKLFPLGSNSYHPFSFFSNFIGGETSSPTNAQKPTYAIIFDTARHMYGSECKDLQKFRHHFKEEMKISPASLSRQIEDELNNSQYQNISGMDATSQYVKREILEVEQSGQLHSMVSHYIQMTEMKNKCLIQKAVNKIKARSKGNLTPSHNVKRTSTTTTSPRQLDVVSDKERTNTPQRSSKALVASSSKERPSTTTIGEISRKIDTIQEEEAVAPEQDELQPKTELNNTGDGKTMESRKKLKSSRFRQRASSTITKSDSGVKRIVRFATSSPVAGHERSLDSADTMVTQSDGFKPVDLGVGEKGSRMNRKKKKVPTATLR